MITADHLLEELPAQLATTVKVVPEINPMLLQSSRQSLLAPATGLRTQLLLQKFNIKFFFGINKSTSGRLFFFFNRKKRSTETIMDVVVDISIRPVPEKRHGLSLALLPVVYRWRVPPFLVLEPEEIERLNEALEGLSARTPMVLTDGGQQTLVIDFEKEGQKPKARIWYQEKEVVATTDKNWPAQPFFVIYECIREWLTNSEKNGRIARLKLDDHNDIRAIVQMITQAFKSARKTLADDNTEASSDARGWTDTLIDYDLTDCHANLLLRLDEKGDLALFNSNRSFQFGLDMTLLERGRHYEALLNMHIPDFLVGGDLSEAFWGVFLDEEESEDYRKKLRKLLAETGSRLTDDELSILLRAGQNGEGTVFRMDRNKKVDINVFVISGKVGEGYVHLVFSGRFVVQATAPPKIRFRGANTLRVHYLPNQNVIDEDLVQYFLRLAQYFKNWIDIL